MVSIKTFKVILNILTFKEQKFREKFQKFCYYVVISLFYFYNFKKRYPEKAVYKVLQTMIRRGEVQHRAQRKLLFRIR